MLFFPSAAKYSLKQSSLLAVSQAIVKLLTSLPDTRVVVIGSSDPSLSAQIVFGSQVEKQARLLANGILSRSLVEIDAELGADTLAAAATICSSRFVPPRGKNSGETEGYSEWWKYAFPGGSPAEGRALSAVNNCYLKLAGSLPNQNGHRLSREPHTLPEDFLEAKGTGPWFPYNLNLEEFFETKILNGNKSIANQANRQQNKIVIWGLGDRFNVLLQATAINDVGQQHNPANPYQLNLVFEPAIAATISTEIERSVQEKPEILAAFIKATDGWSAQPNLPALQSEFTLHLLAAMDAMDNDADDCSGQENSNLDPSALLLNASLKPVHELKQEGKNSKTVEGGLIKNVWPISELPIRSAKTNQNKEGKNRVSTSEDVYPRSQQQLLLQEKLLHQLLRVNRSPMGAQAILQRSATVIQETLGVSRCLIAFYSGKNASRISGAIAFAQEIPLTQRQNNYPDWHTIEQHIQQHYPDKSWATEPQESDRAIEPIFATPAAKSLFLSWFVPGGDRAKNSFQSQAPSCGLLLVEQWEQDRVWQTWEKQLLHLALHQVHQSLEEADLYQKAQERANHAALLNRLVEQIRASLELPKIFETVTSELGQLLVADRCSILQYLEEPQSWQPITEYRAHNDIPTAINLIVPDQNNPVISQLHNLHVVEVSDTRVLEDPFNQFLAEKYPGAWLMVPIHRQEKIWGCLAFNQDRCTRYWHHSELNFLIAVADQLAIAIHQATLYQQIQQQNQTLEALVLARTAELESFFDAHPDSIFVVERQDLRLRFCNHAFAHSLGLENRHSVQGRSILECKSGLLANSFAKQNLRVFESGQTLHEQETLHLADGIHHFDTFRVPLKHPNGEVYACLGTSRDITELVQTKQALSDLTDQLQQALIDTRSASQAKSEFLASMSHELRTPLTAVIGMSSALLKQYFGSLNPKQSEYIQIIHNSGQHLLQLINDILDLSKIEAGKASLSIDQFSLRDVAEVSMALLREKAQVQKVKLVADLEGLPLNDNFYGDERRVKQILLNLLSNAVKFTPAGGMVRLCIYYDGHAVKIEVADTGIGIPPEQQHLLFQAFQQIDSYLSRQHQGTGLGLALTRQLVEMHGGKIEFKSTVGVGTVFAVYLQAQPPQLDTATEDVECSEVGNSQSVKFTKLNVSSHAVALPKGEETAVQTNGCDCKQEAKSS